MAAEYHWYSNTTATWIVSITKSLPSPCSLVLNAWDAQHSPALRKYLQICGGGRREIRDTCFWMIFTSFLAVLPKCGTWHISGTCFWTFFTSFLAVQKLVNFIKNIRNHLLAKHATQEGKTTFLACLTDGRAWRTDAHRVFWTLHKTGDQDSDPPLPLSRPASSNREMRHSCWKKKDFFCEWMYLGRYWELGARISLRGRSNKLKVFFRNLEKYFWVNFFFTFSIIFFRFQNTIFEFSSEIWAIRPFAEKLSFFNKNVSFPWISLLELAGRLRCRPDLVTDFFANLIEVFSVSNSD